MSTARLPTIPPATSAPEPDPIERVARAAAAGAVAELPDVLEALKGSSAAGGPKDPVARLLALMVAAGLAVAIVWHEAGEHKFERKMDNTHRALERLIDAEAAAHPEHAAAFRAAERELRR